MKKIVQSCEGGWIVLAQLFQTMKIYVKKYMSVHKILKKKKKNSKKD